jgi:hypothetical protein
VRADRFDHGWPPTDRSRGRYLEMSATFYPWRCPDPDYPQLSADLDCSVAELSSRGTAAKLRAPRTRLLGCAAGYVASAAH